MKKIFLITAVFCLLFIGWSIRDGKTKEQSYYSGDAVFYQNRLLVASANTGKLEVFALTDGKLNRILSFSVSPSPSKEEIFNDVKLDVQGQSLKVYAVAGYTLYRYDLSDLQSLKLDNKTRNTYWEWYQRVDRFGDNIVTVSQRGVRIWNNNLDVIDGFDFIGNSLYSLRSSGDKRFFLGLNDSSLQIYDRESRSVVKTITLNYRDFAKNNRKPYYDRISGDVFTIDDYYAKKFDFNGRLLASFHHNGDSSYDAESTFDNDFIYFSNGLNVLKLKKSDLSLVKETSTTALGAAQGWAMGLKLVNTPAGDRLVVFNNSSILIMDADLKLLSSTGKISQDDGQLYPLENLYLALGNRSAQPGANINLQGGGFWPNEELSINLRDVKTKIHADRFGRFNTDIKVPAAADGRYDIKVDGVSSGFTYSISLAIKN